MAQLYFPLTVQASKASRQQAHNYTWPSSHCHILLAQCWQNSPATPLTAGFIQQSHCPHAHLTVELTRAHPTSLCNTRLPGTSVTPASYTSPLSHRVPPDGQTDKGNSLRQSVLPQSKSKLTFKRCPWQPPQVFPPQILWYTKAWRFPVYTHGITYLVRQAENLVVVMKLCSTSLCLPEWVLRKVCGT